MTITLATVILFDPYCNIQWYISCLRKVALVILEFLFTLHSMSQNLTLRNYLEFFLLTWFFKINYPFTLHVSVLDLLHKLVFKSTFTFRILDFFYSCQFSLGVFWTKNYLRYPIHNRGIFAHFSQHLTHIMLIK